MTKTRLLTVAAMASAALLWSSGAFATPVLNITSGASSATVTSATNVVRYSNANFNGWNIIISLGVSSSPGLSPFGLDITNLVVTCGNLSVGCSGNTLNINLSDTGFTQTAARFTNNYSLTGTGTTTQTAYFDTANTLFGKAGVIGTVSLTSTGSGSIVGGGPAGPSPYSLTLADTFAAGSNVSYSSDGSVNVPEPGSLALLGTALIGIGALGFARRGRRA